MNEDIIIEVPVETVTIELTPEGKDGLPGPQGPQGPAGISEWGQIEGLLSNQIDLQEALNNKVNNFGNISANQIFAGPVIGQQIPSFRPLVAKDIPELNASKITSGCLQTVRGGTGGTDSSWIAIKEELIFSGTIYYRQIGPFVHVYTSSVKLLNQFSSEFILLTSRLPKPKGTLYFTIEYNGKFVEMRILADGSLRLYQNKDNSWDTTDYINFTQAYITLL